ncbi:MFS transporter [Paenibacillus sabinae]|uniref:Major facilitator superfamily protein n=1 Tax=Paenibacillus sabinae T27 TaxID=1268072 RepID=X4ZTF8_9BACL|nr:MFS transporter [Paenibacillus sabinae]AHV95154.1 major facilitator superfamily protein [Paenibacillus sabinae T27]
MNNVACFYIYRIVSRLYFHLPILFVYFYLQHLSLPIIELLLAVYGLVVMLTAKWNVKLMALMRQTKVIAIGEGLKGIGLLLLVSDTHMGVLLLGQIACGLGYSLAAGTDSSLLRSLFSEQDQKRYQKTESSSASYMFLSVLLAGIAGSMFFGSNIKLPFYLSIASNVLSLAVILLIRNPGHTAQGVLSVADKSRDGQKEPAAALELTPGQRYWKRYYALIRAFTLAPFVGFIPFLLYRRLEIGLFYFGLVLSLFTLLGFISARYAVRVGVKIGENRLVIATTLLSVLSMIVVGLSQHIGSAAVAIALMGLASGGARPLAAGQLNGSGMRPAERTAVLSSMERMYGFWNALLLIAGGFVLQEFGLRILMFGLAAAFFLASAVSLLLRRGKTSAQPVTGQLPS